MSALIWQLQQDDNIDDEEAIREYAAYKLKFKTEQLNKFFADHKDEEWYVDLGRHLTCQSP